MPISCRPGCDIHVNLQPVHVSGLADRWVEVQRPISLIVPCSPACVEVHVGWLRPEPVSILLAPCLPWRSGLEQPSQCGRNPRWVSVALSAGCHIWWAQPLNSSWLCSLCCTCKDTQTPIPIHANHKSKCIYMKHSETQIDTHTFYVTSSIFLRESRTFTVGGGRRGRL